MTSDATPAVQRWPYDDFEQLVVEHLNTCEDRASCPCWLPDLLALNDPLPEPEAPG